MTSNKTSASHITLAYIALITMILLAWSLVVSPLMTSWHAHRAETIELRAKVNKQFNDSSENKTQAAEVTRELNALISSGDLSVKDSAANLSHEAQESIKLALENAGARLDQIRPSQLDSSTWLHHTNLDVRFQIDPNKLGDLLASLNQAHPRPAISLLSLRAPTTWGYELSDGKRGSQLLEANLQLTSVSATDALMTLFKELESSEPQLSAPGSQASNMQLEALGGLFNKDVRARHKTPGPQHYRLSAITRSSQAAVAILIDKQSGVTHRLKEGSDLEGWAIDRITESSVHLKRANQDFELRL